MYWNNGSVNIWLRLNQHNFNPRNSHICWIIIRNHICLIVPQGGIGIKRSGILLCIFWYTNISYVTYEKFARGGSPTQTPTLTLKSGLYTFGSQDIDSSLVSFEMIFEALQLELFNFKLHSLSSTILKIPGFNLVIYMNLNSEMTHESCDRKSS